MWCLNICVCHVRQPSSFQTGNVAASTGTVALVFDLIETWITPDWQELGDGFKEKLKPAEGVDQDEEVRESIT